MAAAARTSVVLASGAPQAEKMVSEPGADTPDARSAVSRARPVAGVSAIGPALGACERRARADVATSARSAKGASSETSQQRRRRRARNCCAQEPQKGLSKHAAARGQRASDAPPRTRSPTDRRRPAG
jgi:hypothetical protein